MDVTQSRHRRRRVDVSCRGVTLVELLLGIAILGVLLGVAAPTFRDLIVSSQLTRHVNTLSRSLYLARQAAIYREHWVVVCKGNRDGCDHSQPWEQGWIVFTDLDHDHRHDANEPVLLVQQAVTDNTRIVLHAFGSTNYIVYHPSGLTGTNGTFTLCDADRQRALIYSKTGRLRVDNGDPAVCAGG